MVSQVLISSTVDNLQCLLLVLDIKTSYILSIIAILIHIASKLLFMVWQRTRREETDDGCSED